MMTLSKSSWLTRRPCARTVAVYSCPGGTGSAPICPDGFTVFGNPASNSLPHAQFQAIDNFRVWIF